MVCDAYLRVCAKHYYSNPILLPRGTSILGIYDVNIMRIYVTCLRNQDADTAVGHVSWPNSSISGVTIRDSPKEGRKGAAPLCIGMYIM